MFIKKYNESIDELRGNNVNSSCTNKGVIKMFDQTKKMAAATFLMGVFFSPVGSTNDLELLATTIPASACRAASDNDDAKLKLKNGAFVFRNGQIGTAALLCPLPINGWRVSLPLFDQFDPELNMTAYQIYFKDSNRCSSSVGIKATFRYRNQKGMKALSSWNSTTEENIGGFCQGGIESNTREEVSSNETLIPGRLYHFLVKISRASDDQKVTFSGIDFPGNLTVPQ